MSNKRFTGGEIYRWGEAMLGHFGTLGRRIISLHVFQKFVLSRIRQPFSRQSNDELIFDHTVGTNVILNAEQTPTLQFNIPKRDIFFRKENI